MYWGLSRTICSVLEEMRSCYKNRNYSNLLSLIDEAQCYANRMESSLGDQKDLKDLHKKIKEKVDELQKLEDKIDGLK